MIKLTTGLLFLSLIGIVTLKPFDAEAQSLSFKCPAGYHYSLALRRCVK